MSEKRERIPLIDLRRQHDAICKEILEATQEVISSGNYILGAQTKAFEDEFASYIGAKFCRGVASGTDAVELALRALDIKEGDEVIAPSHTAVGTIVGISRAGATPVLAEIDPRSRCIDPNSIKSLISSKTKGIVAVHLYGQPASVLEIYELCKSKGVYLIEDCAQATGASIKGKKVGCIGDAAAFSFYPTKNLGALGDGGAVTTSDPKVYENLTLLREYGWKKRYVSSVSGINSRLDELQGAILRKKLKYLNSWNQKRREIAKVYKESIDTKSVILPSDIEGTESVYHLFVIEVENRIKFQEHLDYLNISTGIHYPMPVHLQPAYKTLKRDSSLQITEKLSERVVSLPLFPELRSDEISYICQQISKWGKSS